MAVLGNGRLFSATGIQGTRAVETQKDVPATSAELKHSEAILRSLGFVGMWGP